MERYVKLAGLLAEKGIEAAIVNHPKNMRYLSGYTGEGCLFISGNARVVVTDFRYIEQAERQAPGWRVEKTSADRPQWQVCAELMAEYGLKVVGTETNCIIYDDFMELQRQLGKAELTTITGVIEAQREIKDADEIASICEAGRIASQAFKNMLEWAKPGMTEKEVQIGLDNEMLKLGSERNAFPTISAAGPNGSLPHAIPSDYVIKNGDLLTLDFGATKNGYLSDMTRTIGFGRIEGELRTIYNLVLDAHILALNAVAPGKVCRDIDAVARNYLDRFYPGRFGHSTGHGVGLNVHEGPRVSTKGETILVPGHVITIEPGLYIPGLGGVRIEDMAIITADGFIDPIDAPKQLIEL